MDKLKFLKKLIEEGKAVAPIIKEAGQGAGAFAKEAQMAQGQKVVQKLMTGEEYAQKMARLRNAAGVAGVVGAGMLMPQDEAAAAGLDTIARKLGVGLEEAAKIKKLATSKVSADVFEENIRAIQKVAEYKRNPESFKKIGHGVDFRALDAGDGKVLKAPKDLTENSEMFQVAPGLMEHAGLGPKTKTIQAGDKSYMLQDKVRPSDEMFKGATRHDDKAIDDIRKQIDVMWKGVDPRDEAQVAKINADPKYQALLDAEKQRQHAIYKAKGFDVDQLMNDFKNTPDDKKVWTGNTEEKIMDDPESSFENMMSFKANQKLGDVIRPNDLHSGNIGYDMQGNPTAFDTSRFSNLKPEKLTDAQREAIMKSNIATPEKKAALQRLLNNSPADEYAQQLKLGKIQDTQQLPDSLKRVAAVGAAPMTPDELLSRPAKELAGMWQAVRQPINNATRKAGEYISDLVTPPGMLTEEARTNQRELAGTMGQMAFDPANFVAPGAGLAVGAADVAADQLAPQPTPEEEQYAKLKGMMVRP